FAWGLPGVAPRRLPLPAGAGTLPVGIAGVGPFGMVQVVWGALRGRRGRLDQLLPDGFPVFAPRPEAVPPADSAVIHNPLEPDRSEGHTSELQSLTKLVCRLLLGKI